jgi:pyruvate formate lyase activating enzyme
MNESEELIGNIHSIQSFGTVDGPGIRTVVFFQGCPLRCKFCHNIDCAPVDGGAREYTVDHLVDVVMKNKEYWSNGRGGVTCSGGEPTFHRQFLVDFTARLHAQGVHVAVDSCTLTSLNMLKKLVPHVDLWMLSFKHYDPEMHKYLTGVDNTIIKKNILALDELITAEKEDSANAHKQIRIRFLVVPGLTDSEEHIAKVAKFVDKLKNCEGVEVLGYGSHGKFKWEKMFGKYELDDVPDATKKDVDRVKQQFKSSGTKLIY